MVDFPAGLFLLLFTVAMLSLWWVPQTGRTAQVPWFVFVMSLAVCLSQGWMRPLALLWLVLLVISVWQFRQTQLLAIQNWQHFLSLAGVIVISLGLATHSLPGFTPIPVLAEATYRNLDKACVAFVLLALLLPRMRQWREFGDAVSVTWWLFLISPVVMFSLAWLVGGIDNVGFGVPQYFWLWAWGNLLVTCVAEELFFRGLLQRYLVTQWREKRWGWPVALCLVSLLFGLVHLGGGWQFALLATVAGAFYGAVYHMSGRIEMAILLHFFINLLYVMLRS